jgi:hypothetical protein
LVSLNALHALVKWRTLPISGIFSKHRMLCKRRSLNEFPLLCKKNKKFSFGEFVSRFGSRHAGECRMAFAMPSHISVDAGKP